MPIMSFMGWTVVSCPGPRNLKDTFHHSIVVNLMRTAWSYFGLLCDAVFYMYFMSYSVILPYIMT